MSNEMIIEPSALLLIHEADFDRQIATAKRFPRSKARAAADIVAYATESEETAGECIFALPRDGKTIKGPSARFAEIVATSWGNSRSAVRIVDEKEDFIIAQAVFHDLETNVYTSIELMRRIVGSNGRRYGVDMIGTTANAAMSIAMRNCTLKAVPRSVWGDAFSKAHAMVAGTFESVEKRRTAALAVFNRAGVDTPLVLAKLGLNHERDILPDHLVTMRGMISAVRDGDTTYERLFERADERRAADRAAQKRGPDLGDKLREGRERDDRARAEDEGNPPAPRNDEDRREERAPPAEKKADEEPRAEEDAEERQEDDVVEHDAPASVDRQDTASRDEPEDESEDDIPPPRLELPPEIASIIAASPASAKLQDFAYACDEAETLKDLTQIDNRFVALFEGEPDEVAKDVRAIRGLFSKAIRAKASAKSRL